MPERETKPTRPGVFSDYDIDLQFEVMRALAARTNVPVPEMLWQEHDPEVIGTSSASKPDQR